MSHSRPSSLASSERFDVTSGTRGPPSVNIDGFAGLETWEDPTPRPSPLTFEDLHHAFVEASKRQMRLRPKSPSREELMLRRQEHDRKSLVMALAVFAKQYNVQPTELELAEIKERNLIDEYGKGYVHFNFTVKRLDGTVDLFFAEVHPDCREVDDVYLCTALNEDDAGHCTGCKDRAKDLVHPSAGDYLGGHKDVGFPFEYYDSEDSEESEDSEDNE